MSYGYVYITIRIPSNDLSSFFHCKKTKQKKLVLQIQSFAKVLLENYFIKQD